LKQRQIKTNVKKAVILAGGEENRLPPLTNYYPAWMLPIINRSLIEFTIDFLRKSGIEEVMIIMSGNDEIPYKLKGHKTPDIHFHIEEKPRGTAGSIKDVEKFIDEETFIVINSNVFIEDIILSKAIEFYHKMKAAALVGVHKDVTKKKVRESVDIAPDGKIKSFHIKYSSTDRESPWRSSGIYIFDPVVLKFINKNTYMDIKEQLIPALQSESLDVFAYEIEGSYQCIDSVNDYIRVQRKILLGSNNKSPYLEDKEELIESVWTGKDVKISPKAYLLGPIVIGDGCTVEDWARIIGPAVIGNGCRISQEVLIRESILLNGICLSSGSKIEYSIIGENTNVPNNSYIKNMIALNGLKIGDANLIPSDYGVKGTVDLSGITPVTHNVYKITKRIIDVAFSAIGIILLLPLFLLIAVMIKIDSTGPLFYTQRRCGIRGKLFGMIKFRTMVANAETLHKELVSKKDIDGPMFKLINDPRVTRFGKVLRKTSLDELPQLFNVLKGEMSLVGPRPLIMDEMKFSPSWRDIRLIVKPGITGLWQVQGRSGAPFHDWIRYDVYYVKNQSLLLDMEILIKTIKVVLKKAGAY
jgi:lipopolysaccharide/colanic/teichoic acid biosynthesis glycosyltransferase/ADP-glucose pyrophosphorylase